MKSAVSLPKKDRKVAAVLLSFFDFLPQDNGGSLDSGKSLPILRHLCGALRLLQVDLKLEELYAEFDRNETLQSFIVTYLMHRKRPYEMSTSDADDGLLTSSHAELNEQLWLLDRLVFLITFRMVTFSEGMVDSKPSINQIRKFPLLRIPNLLSLFCIVGDSNEQASRTLMSNLVSLSGVDFVASQVVDMMEDCREMLDRLLTQCKAITSEHNSGMEVVSSKFKSTWKTSVRAAPLGGGKEKKEKIVWEEDSRLLRGLWAKRGGEGKGSRTVDEARVEGITVCELAVLAQDIGACLCACVSTMPSLVALGQGHSDALLMGDGSGLRSPGLTLLQNLQSLFDKVLPSIERAISWCPSQILSKTQGLGVQHMVDVCRNRVKRALLVLTRIATEISPSLCETYKQMETEVVYSWMEVLQMMLQDVQQAEHPVLVLEAYGTVSSSSSSSLGGAGADLFEGGMVMKQHLLHLGEDKDAVEYTFATLEAIWKEHQERRRVGRDRQRLKPMPVTTHLEDQNGLTTIKNSNTTYITKIATGGANNVDILKAVTSLRVLFPELGEGYCYACLDSFEWDLERTVDAVLSQNLPPTVLGMNRTIEARLDRVISDIRKAVKVDEREHERTQFREREKLRLLAVQAREEDDEQLLRKHGIESIIPAHLAVQIEREKEKRDEGDYTKEVSPMSVISMPVLPSAISDAGLYDDDYDDQWDDATVMMPFAQKQKVAVVTGNRQSPSVFTTGGGKKAMRQGKKEAARETAQRMEKAFALAAQEQREVLRVNTLVKQRQEEEAYWRSLVEADKISNMKRMASRVVSEDVPVLGKEAEKAEIRPPQEAKGMLQHQGKHQSQPKKEQEQQGQEHEKKHKHRTKTFDKHRQKKKALRKGDTFKG